MTVVRPPDRGDAGDTLVEILVAITILGMCVAALLGGLLVALGSSTTHRSLTNVDTVLRSFAEAAQYDIELQSSPWYQAGTPGNCPTVSGPMVSPATYAGNQISLPPDAPSPPTGWSSPYFVALDYVHETWNGVSQSFATSGPDTSCTGCPDESQLLTVGLSGPDGSTEQLTVGLRNPVYNPNPVC